MADAAVAFLLENLKQLLIHHTKLIKGVKGHVEQLKAYAFWGPTWVVDDRGFNSLEVLHIAYTNLSFWIASSLHFPKLKRLRLTYCYSLIEVPIGLADIVKFECLELYRCRESADASARKIEEEKDVGTFKLSITPWSVY